jgi:tRNA-Thr(GGU) m(6)t(6)A37 methyltransferase TsaA
MQAPCFSRKLSGAVQLSPVLSVKMGYYCNTTSNLPQKLKKLMTDITIEPIGILHCDLKTRAQAPKNYDESGYRGTIEIYPQFLAGLADIQPGDTIVVLFWLDRADRNVLRVHPRGDTSRPKRGVFSTRSPDRPNPIAVSELLVEDVKDHILAVKNLDILDSTPVLDIKKKISPARRG